MEKIKPYLLKIGQHHIWILFLIALIALFYAWNTGTAEMSKSFNSNKAKSSKQFSSLNKQGGSRGGSNFPNEQWIENRKQLTQQLVKSGDKAWNSVKQSQQTIQSWPASLHEQSIVEINDDDWNKETIEDYQRIVPEEVQQLRVMLDAVETTDNPGVLWNMDDYKNLVGSVELIKTEADCKQFQQLLWIYKALALAIQQTNKGVEDRFNLPIHSIEDTAILEAAANDIDDDGWKIAVDVIRADDKQKSTNPKGKKNAKKSPVGFTLPSIGVSISDRRPTDGYIVIPFRFKIRMQMQFLAPLLRSLANAPIPLIIEGLRFSHDPQLEVVKSKSSGRSRGSRGRGSGSRGAPSERKPKISTGTGGASSPESGTLVEIWGFAYLVNTKPSVKESKKNQAVQRKTRDLATVGQS